MATNRLGHVLQHLRKLNARPSAGHPEDRLLLARFVNDRDEAAFEELLVRHGPMVLDVCRRVLHDPAAVDDAFQATFLVLVRKAASIRKAELLANWLYGVAYRTAARARVEVAKRRARESAVPAREAVHPLDEMTLRELFAVLDEELHGLAAQYRAPLVLCYLENRTRDEAAQQSGCSLATLDRRLERGRALLKARMVRRGVTLGLALFPALLSQADASGGVANSLAASTVKAAAFIASGGAAPSIVSFRVTILVEGVLKAMFLTKLKTVTAVLLVVGMIASGGGLLTYQIATAQQDRSAEINKGKGAETKKREEQRKQDQAERAALEGTWSEVYLEINEKKQPAWQRYEWTFKDGKAELRCEREASGDDQGFKSPEPPVQLTLTVDPSKSPKEITMSNEGGAKILFHIYKLEKDTLTLVYFGGAAARPKGFTLKDAGDLSAGVLVLEVYERKRIPKAEDKKPEKADVKPKGDAGLLVHSLPGHKERLTSVAYSSDGQCIATAAWDGTIRLWDPKSGKEVRRLDVPPTTNYNPAYLSQILFSPDSESVVVAQQSGPNEPGVIVWNRRTGERMRDFPGLCAAIAPDGKHIACGGWGTPDPNRGDIRLYEFATGKVLREIHSHYSRIDRLTFSPDGKTLFAQVGIPRPPLGGGIQRLGRDGAQVRAWDVATGKERQTGLEGAWNEHRFALSPDGRTLALATHGISLRETATGGERAKLTGHTNEVCGVAFSPDGRTLASGSMDGTVRLWDLPSGKEVGRFGEEVPQFAGRGWVLAVAFSPDGRTVVSGGLDKTALVWDVSKITRRRGASAERSSSELEADWKDLGGDAAKAYAALGRLISSPKQAVSSLGKQLQSAKPADTRRIEQLIGNLDDDRFEVRAQATKELDSLGEYAVPLLQKALAGNPSLEVRRRMGALLDRLEGASLSAETVRQIRAVEALEAIGNPETLRLLEKLATGTPEMRLTQEALASARRLAKRASVAP